MKDVSKDNPHYDEESSDFILSKYSNISDVQNHLLFNLELLRQKLDDDKASEYLMQGVARRVGTIVRCIHNIFRIFPINRIEVLNENDRSDLCINLQAFVVNIFGILDNLAWVHAFEKDLSGDPKEGKLGRFDVDLFGEKMQEHLGKYCLELIKSDSIKQWHNDYCKDFRDALAHRIPLYVPPSVITNKENAEWIELQEQLTDLTLIDKHEEIHSRQIKLGKAKPAFTHSFSEGSTPILFHAQIVSDLTTIKEIIGAFCKDYDANTNPGQLHNGEKNEPVSFS